MDTNSSWSWSVERRLQFIEYRLLWEGRVNRSDLVDYFGISVPQASADLARYQELAGANIRYDRRAKTYVADPNFAPRLIAPNARLYLANLRLIADDVLAEHETWARWLPPFAVLPLIRRRIEPNKLREILAAIQTCSAIYIRYQSLTQPDPSWRWITPHALVFDGRRWHARAWCHRNRDFRDFVFARMLEISERRPDHIDPSDDLGWQLEVTARLAPHPGLDESRRRVIELDYDMENGVAEVPMKLCLAYYFVRQFGFDTDPNSSDPNRQQVVLLNGDEIKALEMAAQQASKKRTADREIYRIRDAERASNQRRRHSGAVVAG